jgi:hypothetical protein
MIGVAASIVVLAVVVVRPQTFWSPDGADLSRSLAGAGDGFTAPEPCQRVTARSWRCPIEDDPGSGTSGSYRLQLSPDNCWTARRAGKRLTGCVGFSDFIGF